MLQNWPVMHLSGLKPFSKDMSLIAALKRCATQNTHPLKSLCASTSSAPSGLAQFPHRPTACAVGCILSPLRGLEPRTILPLFPRLAKSTRRGDLLLSPKGVLGSHGLLRCGSGVDLLVG